MSHEYPNLICNENLWRAHEWPHHFLGHHLSTRRVFVRVRSTARWSAPCSAAGRRISLAVRKRCCSSACCMSSRHSAARLPAACGCSPRASSAASASRRWLRRFTFPKSHRGQLAGDVPVQHRLRHHHCFRFQRRHLVHWLGRRLALDAWHGGGSVCHLRDDVFRTAGKSALAGWVPVDAIVPACAVGVCRSAPNAL